MKTRFARTIGVATFAVSFDGRSYSHKRRPSRKSSPTARRDVKNTTWFTPPASRATPDEYPAVSLWLFQIKEPSFLLSATIEAPGPPGLTRTFSPITRG